MKTTPMYILRSAYFSLTEIDFSSSIKLYKKNNPEITHIKTNVVGLYVTML